LSTGPDCEVTGTFEVIYIFVADTGTTGMTAEASVATAGATAVFLAVSARGLPVIYDTGVAAGVIGVRPMTSPDSLRCVAAMAGGIAVPATAPATTTAGASEDCPGISKVG
jgi:hypothetical protein